MSEPKPWPRPEPTCLTDCDETHADECPNAEWQEEYWGRYFGFWGRSRAECRAIVAAAEDREGFCPECGGAFDEDLRCPPCSLEREIDAAEAMNEAGRE